MEKNVFAAWFSLSIIMLIILAGLSLGAQGTNNGFRDATQNCENTTQNIINSSASSKGTDYWGLLIAVGIYDNVPVMDRPTMLSAVDNLYNVLLRSSQWNSNNIRVITGEQAIPSNILRGFKWLDEMENEDDICLVYLTTHGFPILFDLPPFDEDDGMDEALATYTGFLPYASPWSWEPLANPLGILTDDLINFLLNRLESKGVCMIVDSCHSGGFNDNWNYKNSRNAITPTSSGPYISLGMQNSNRVVLTSVREEDISYGSYFSQFLTEGMKGYADRNSDGICTAEEIFFYAQPIVENYFGLKAQMFDNYPGELSLT